MCDVYFQTKQYIFSLRSIITYAWIWNSFICIDKLVYIVEKFLIMARYLLVGGVYITKPSLLYYSLEIWSIISWVIKSWFYLIYQFWFYRR